VRVVDGCIVGSGGDTGKTQATKPAISSVSALQARPTAIDSTRLLERDEARRYDEKKRRPRAPLPVRASTRRELSTSFAARRARVFSALRRGDVADDGRRHGDGDDARARGVAVELRVDVHARGGDHGDGEREHGHGGGEQAERGAGGGGLKAVHRMLLCVCRWFDARAAGFGFSICIGARKFLSRTREWIVMSRSPEEHGVATNRTKPGVRAHRRRWPAWPQRA